MAEEIRLTRRFSKRELAGYLGMNPEQILDLQLDGEILVLTLLVKPFTMENRDKMGRRKQTIALDETGTPDALRAGRLDDILPRSLIEEMAKTMTG
jgi:hypothetical protein